MSKSGTPYRGAYPIGCGGTQGRYPSATLVGNSTSVTTSTGAVNNYANKQAVVQPLLTQQPGDPLGSQYLYVKPSVLSTYGMLRKRYRWAYNGQYPNYWVQPIYDSATQSATASQGLYLEGITSKNTRYINVNNSEKYINYIKESGPAGCKRSTAMYTYNLLSQNAPYTKELSQPIPSSTYTTYIQRRCIAPYRDQKPFPYSVTTGKATSVAGTSVRSFSTGCNTGPIYLTPPDWYTQNPYSNPKDVNLPSGKRSIC